MEEDGAAGGEAKLRKRRGGDRRKKPDIYHLRRTDNLRLSLSYSAFQQRVHVRLGEWRRWTIINLSVAFLIGASGRVLR